MFSSSLAFRLRLVVVEVVMETDNSTLQVVAGPAKHQLLLLGGFLRRHLLFGVCPDLVVGGFVCSS